MINRLVLGNCRDTVKFVAKHLPCTCLKKLHRAVREKVAKMGICFGCQQPFPRSPCARVVALPLLFKEEERLTN